MASRASKLQESLAKSHLGLCSGTVKNPKKEEV